MGAGFHDFEGSGCRNVLRDSSGIHNYNSCMTSQLDQHTSPLCMPLYWLSGNKRTQTKRKYSVISGDIENITRVVLIYTVWLCVV